MIESVVRKKQEELERNLINQRVNDYKNSYLAKLNKDDLLLKEFDNHVSFLEAWLENQTTQKSKNKFYSLLELIDPGLIVYITLSEMLSDKHDYLLDSALAVGEAISRELKFCPLKIKKPELLKGILKKLSSRYSNDLRYREYTIQKYLDYTPLELEKKHKVQLGVLLIHIMLVNSNRFFLSKQRINKKTYNKIKLTYTAQRLKEQLELHGAMSYSKHIPRLTTEYLHKELKYPAVKRSPNLILPDKFIKILEYQDQQKCYINSYVLTLLEKVLQNPRLQKVFKINFSKPKLPNYPYQGSRKAIQAWKTDIREYHDTRAERIQKGLMLRKILKEAKEYQGDPFMFGHQYDFRGRIYSLGSALNYQGYDLPRALVSIKRTRDISLTAHLEYLNKLTKGLGTLEDLVQPEKNLDLYLMFDDPWQVYAHASYLGLQPVYFSEPPIYIDGKANGLYHIAGYTQNFELLDLLDSEDPYATLAKGLDLPRDLVKQVVLAYPYGLTDYSIKKLTQDNYPAVKELLNTKLTPCVNFRENLKSFIKARLESNDLNYEFKSISGFPVNHRYQKAKTKDYRSILGDYRLKVNYQIDSNKIDKKKQVNSFPANLVHSLDAGHLHTVIQQAMYERLSLLTIHDAIGVQGHDVPRMLNILNFTFADLYGLSSTRQAFR